MPLAQEKYGLAVCSDLCLKSVLICDDEAFNLMTLQAMLSDLDVDAECIESGVSAVNRFRFRLSLKCCSRTYRLVMTDISMPVMDGFEVCQQIMQTQKFWFENMNRSQSILKFKTKRRTPVVAVSAFTD